MAEEERPRKLQKVVHEPGSGAKDDKIAIPISAPTTDTAMSNDSSITEKEPPTTSGDDSRAASEAGPLARTETGDEVAPALSKNQLKKLKKLERWEAGREWRKEKRKEKMKARKERERAAKAQAAAEEPSEAPEGEEQGDGSPAGRITLRQLRKRDNGRSVVLPITLLLDCDFDDLMLDKERKSLASQITQRFDTVLAKQYERWKGVTLTEDDFVLAAESAQARMKQPRGGRLAGMFSRKAEIGKSKLEEEGEIVYLTSDSPDTLTELKPYSTYIIGGLVDKNRHKGICYKRATEKGFKTAKLPIGDYMEMSSRSVLATNHVVEIMIRWLELGDWGQAFDRVIPKRKGGTLKTSSTSEEKNEVEKDMQVQEQQDNVKEGNKGETSPLVTEGAGNSIPV
uniref:tRNA (guanine(9)-N1)-methyltransferase n=1 Tax=Coccidioides posadasii RMSCC 3488 TaxID=454284 RepID=A0A0J6ICT1_COCPO|nr:tRNA (guanine-N(1)-)-methyltransferase [Coccidioides posadasii RMSCC 3488]